MLKVRDCDSFQLQMAPQLGLTHCASRLTHRARVHHNCLAQLSPDHSHTVQAPSPLLRMLLSSFCPGTENTLGIVGHPSPTLPCMFSTSVLGNFQALLNMRPTLHPLPSRPPQQVCSASSQQGMPVLKGAAFFMNKLREHKCSHTLIRTCTVSSLALRLLCFLGSYEFLLLLSF